MKIPELLPVGDKKSRYILYRNKGPLDGRKTDSVELWNINGTAYLGMFMWYAPWRKYCWYPSSDSIFDPTCLKDIHYHLEGLNQDYKRKIKESKIISKS